MKDENNSQLGAFHTNMNAPIQLFRDGQIVINSY